jgi:hypothetical protein
MKLDNSLRVGLSGEAKIIEAFAVVANTEPVEGRGQSYDHSYYRTRDDAVIGASGEGTYQSDAAIEPRLVLYFKTASHGYYFVLDGHQIEFTDVYEKRKALKEKAESKLSVAERLAIMKSGLPGM